MRTILEVHRVSVRRGENFQLYVSKLRLKGGQVLCVTGPNGSGKTTLIETLGGLLVPDGGFVKVNGKLQSPALQSLKAQIGYIPDDEGWLIAELCAQEYFDLLVDTYSRAGIRVDMNSRIRSLSSALQFSAISQQLHSLSHGNKKKVQIIAGLMHRPSLIVIDELRNGLDPLAIIAAERLIKDEAERGACVVAATHDLWWAQRIADEVVFIRSGSVAAYGTTAGLITQYGSLENLFLHNLQGKNNGTGNI